MTECSLVNVFVAIFVGAVFILIAAYVPEIGKFK